MFSSFVFAGGHVRQRRRGTLPAGAQPFQPRGQRQRGKNRAPPRFRPQARLRRHPDRAAHCRSRHGVQDSPRRNFAPQGVQSSAGVRGADLAPPGRGRGGHRRGRTQPRGHGIAASSVSAPGNVPRHAPDDTESVGGRSRGSAVVSPRVVADGAVSVFPPRGFAPHRRRWWR